MRKQNQSSALVPMAGRILQSFFIANINARTRKNTAFSPSLSSCPVKIRANLKHYIPL